MAERQSAWARYESKVAEADRLAKQAARELREETRGLVDELKELAAAYAKELTDQELPELARLAPRAAKTSRPASASTNGRASGRATQGRRTKLTDAYAGLTIPEAIHKAVGRSKTEQKERYNIRKRQVWSTR